MFIRKTGSAKSGSILKSVLAMAPSPCLPEKEAEETLSSSNRFGMALPCLFNLSIGHEKDVRPPCSLPTCWSARVGANCLETADQRPDRFTEFCSNASKPDASVKHSWEQQVPQMALNHAPYTGEPRLPVAS